MRTPASFVAAGSAATRVVCGPQQRVSGREDGAARNAATPCSEPAGQAAALGCDERRWRACPAPRITVVLLYSEDIHIRCLVANTLFWRLFVGMARCLLVCRLSTLWRWNCSM